MYRWKISPFLHLTALLISIEPKNNSNLPGKRERELDEQVRPFSRLVQSLYRETEERLLSYLDDTASAESKGPYFLFVSILVVKLLASIPKH